MCDRDSHSIGINHVTVVPANFEKDEEDEDEDEDEAEEASSQDEE